MPISNRSAQIAELDKFLDNTELNPETRGIASEIFAICQRFERSMDRERRFKAKQLGGGAAAQKVIEMPPNFNPNEYVPVEKKSPTVQPVDQTPNENTDPEPIEVDQKDETTDLKIFDLFTAGIEGAKASYPKAGAFKKALKDLGIQADGKTHEDLWSALQLKFDEINNK